MNLVSIVSTRIMETLDDLPNHLILLAMPSMQSWQQEAAPDQLYYPSDTVINHNRHYPFGASGSNTDLSLAGIEEMTQAVQMYLPTPDLKDPLANFR